MSRIQINNGADPGGAIYYDAVADELVIESYGPNKVRIPSGKITAEEISSIMLTGMIAPFGMPAAPPGWLVCNGAALSRTTYSELFTAIGTTWGVGDGGTTFNLPDLRGAFLRATGTGSINARDKVGPTAVGEFQEDQMQRITANHGRNRWGEHGGMFFHGAFYNSGSHSGDGASSSGGGRARLGFDSALVTRTGEDSHPYAAGVLYCIKY